MNPDSENFEPLRRLLALKRHEQPPPGYFNHFSRDVITRIKAGERGSKAGESTWLQRLWEILEAKPMLGGAFGAALCAMLISGILNSEERGIVPPMPMAISPGATQLASAPPTMAIDPNSPQLASDTNSIALSELFNFQPPTTLQRVSETLILPGGY